MIRELPPALRAAAIGAYQTALTWIFAMILGASLLMLLANALLEPRRLPGFGADGKQLPAPEEEGEEALDNGNARR